MALAVTVLRRRARAGRGRSHSSLAWALAAGLWAVANPVSAASPPSPPGGSLEAIEELPARPGEPRVLLTHREGGTAALVIRFACGAVDDDLAGQTRLAQHALLAANARLDLAQFTDDLHAAAATLHMTTGARDATFVLTADRRDFPLLARRLATALLDPQFLPDRLQQAVDRARLDDPGEPDLLQTLATVAGDDVRYGNSAVASVEELDAITVGHVARHLKGRLSPANAVVVVSGSFQRAETVRMLRAFRGGMPSAKRRVRLAVPFETRRASPHEYHVLAFPLSIDGPRQAASARLVGEVLSNALWRRFRRAGLGYSQEASAIRNDWIEVLVLFVAARDAGVDLEPVLREVVAEILEGKLSEADLERARAAVRAQLLKTDAEPEELALMLASAGPVWQSRELAAELERLDRPALLDTVRRWLDPGSSIYVYLGSEP